MNRRSFLRSSAVLAAFAPTLRAAEKKKKSEPAAPAEFKPSRTTPRPNKKALMLNTFGGPTASKLSLKERFQMLRAAGFHGVEVNGMMNQSEVLAARDAAGLEIPSVVVSTHWTFPLSSPNPGDREKCVEGTKQALRDAKAYGASSVLLVPAVVRKDTSYADAYKRSVEEIKKCIPLAEELGVAIAIENVWNYFLMSPLEAANYVDSFKSPMVKWHLDVGNLVVNAWPEHWIRALGPRTVKIHVKEYSRKLRDEKGQREGFKVALFEGDSDWPAVMAALDDVKYTGWLITEQTRMPADLTDEQYLAGLVKSLDKILVA